MTTQPASRHLYHGSIDSHCHLSLLQEKVSDVTTLLAKNFAGGLAALLDVAVDEQQFEQRLNWAKQYPNKIYLSAGIHPLYCGPTSTNGLEKRLRHLEEQLSQQQVVAIGECGFDNYRCSSELLPWQRRYFAAQLELARSCKLPLVIHNRNADTELELAMASCGDLTGVLHCFSGSQRLLELFAERNFYFSFAGNISYKNSSTLRQTASLIPIDRLLVETDAPFLSPQPVRGQINHSGYIGYTIDVLANCCGISAVALVDKLRDNFAKFIGLKHS